MVARQRETPPCPGPPRAGRLAAAACLGVGLALLLALSAGAPAKAGVRRPLRAQPGFDATTFDPLVTAGIAVGAYPGAVLVVGRRDSVTIRARLRPSWIWARTSPVPNPDSTLYDLAIADEGRGDDDAAVMLLVRPRPCAVGRARGDLRAAGPFDGPGTGTITGARAA